MSIDITPDLLTRIAPPAVEPGVLGHLEAPGLRPQTRLDRAMSRLLHSRAVWLTPVLLVQGLMAFRSSNSAAENEAAWINAGHQVIAHLLHGTPTPNLGRSLAGVPSLYAVPAALLSDVGGVSLLRVASTGLALIATLFVYFTTRRLFGQGAALIAAGLFGLNSVTLFIAHFASADALAVALLAASLWLAVTSNDRPRRAIALGPCLVLAGAASYLAVPLLPAALVLVTLHAARTAGAQRARQCAAYALGSFAVAAVIGLLVAGRGDLAGLRSILLDHHTMTTVAAAALRHQLWTDIGPLLVVGVLAVVLATRNRLIAGLLVLAALISIGIEIYVGTVNPAQDSSGVVLVFLAPAVGATAMAMLRRGRLLGIRVPLALGGIAVLVATGAGSSAQLLHAWPSSGTINAALRPYVHHGSQRYLVDGDAVPAYYLAGATRYGQWTDTACSQYTAPGGAQLLRQQLVAGRYALFLYGTGGATAGLDHSMLAALQANYTLVAKLPMDKNGAQGHWYLWQREPSG